MNKKVLITGISGQDGSIMAEYLLGLGHTVYGMTRHSASRDNVNFKGLLNAPNFHIVSGDLTDQSSICHLVKDIEPEYFINFAAQSFVAESWTSPVSTFEIDATGVLHCLEAIRQYAPKCRFYSAGTSEQLSDVEYVPQDESHPRSAKSPYGAAKIAAEQLVRVYRHSYNLYAIHGILFNHESENRGEQFVTRKITKGVARIKKENEDGIIPMPIELGFLDSLRDWSHAEDFVKGVWMMLNQEFYLNKSSKGFVPQEYVLSSGECHSVREFVEKAFEAAGIKGKWVGSGEDEKYIPDNELRGNMPLVTINPKFYRPFEVTKLHGTSQKIKDDLGWEPDISFSELVKRMVENDIKLLDN